MQKETREHVHAIKLDIPEGVTVEINETVRVQGPRGLLERKLTFPGVRIKKDDEAVVVYSDMKRARQKAMVGTIAGHIKNMIQGVTEGFEYRMKVVYSHFPIRVKVQGNEVVIENFLGEKHPRKARIIGQTRVEVKGDQLIISGVSKEDCGQTAANIEQSTRVRGYDIRVFQDGIYIVEKP